MTTIAVGAARRHAAQQLGDELRHWLSNDVSILRTGPEPASTRRVIVGTLSALGACSARLCHRDVFVVDAMDALSSWGKMALTDARRARFVGLLPQGVELSAHDVDEVRSVFGFAEVDMPKHGCRTRSVAVIIEPNQAERLPPGTDALALKRRCVWLNHARNRRIARLCRAVACRDMMTLAAQFPNTAAAIEGITTPKVMLLTDNVEHVEALVKHLPGWTTVVKGDANADSRGQVSPNVIVSMAAANQVPLDAFDVVVRADAGVGLPSWHEHQLVVPNGCHQALLLVDFDDRRNMQLQRWSQRRQRAYRDAGWYAPGTDPIIARVDAFLASRPR